MFLIVGLGNPGIKYALTRHNVGFWVVDALASRARVSLKKVGCQSNLAQAALVGKKIILAKPLTYMNRSGLAVRALLQFFSLEPEKLLVIYDDLDLPLGRLRLRARGGSGGHRGMASIIALIGDDHFTRLRLGIGRPPDEGENEAGYVLTPFTADQEQQVLKTVQQAADAVETFLAHGLEAAMNIYNAPLEDDEKAGL